MNHKGHKGHKEVQKNASVTVDVAQAFRPAVSGEPEGSHY